ALWTEYQRLNFWYVAHCRSLAIAVRREGMFLQASGRIRKRPRSQIRWSRGRQPLGFLRGRTGACPEAWSRRAALALVPYSRADIFRAAFTVRTLQNLGVPSQRIFPLPPGSGNVPKAVNFASGLPSLADAQSPHHPHDRDLVPDIAAAWRLDAAVRQRLRNLA